MQIALLSKNKKSAIYVISPTELEKILSTASAHKIDSSEEITKSDLDDLKTVITNSKNKSENNGVTLSEVISLITLVLFSMIVIIRLIALIIQIAL